MKVVLLTQEQKEQLTGLEFISDNYFNPIQDEDSNWVISLEEADQCDIAWIKELPQIDYKPVQIEIEP